MRNLRASLGCGWGVAGASCVAEVLFWCFAWRDEFNIFWCCFLWLPKGVVSSAASNFVSGTCHDIGFLDVVQLSVRSYSLGGYVVICGCVAVSGCW